MAVKVVTKIIRADELSQYDIGVSAVLSAGEPVACFIESVTETFCRQLVPGKFNLLNVNGIFIVCMIEGIADDDRIALQHNETAFMKLCHAVMRSLAGTMRTTSCYLSNLLLCCAEKGIF